MIFCALVSLHVTHKTLYTNLGLLFQVVKSASPLFLLITLFGAVLMYTEVNITVFSLWTYSCATICILKV